MGFIGVLITFLSFAVIVLIILRSVTRELDSGRCEADDRSSGEKSARGKS